MTARRSAVCVHTVLSQRKTASLKHRDCRSRRARIGPAAGQISPRICCFSLSTKEQHIVVFLVVLAFQQPRQDQTSQDCCSRTAIRFTGRSVYGSSGRGMLLAVGKGVGAVGGIEENQCLRLCNSFNFGLGLIKVLITRFLPGRLVLVKLKWNVLGSVGNGYVCSPLDEPLSQTEATFASECWKDTSFPPLLSSSHFDSYLAVWQRSHYLEAKRC